jgi:hypothetical protein
MIRKGNLDSFLLSFQEGFYEIRTFLDDLKILALDLEKHA